MIFKFLTLKKEVDTETVKNELTDVFDFARNLKIEISHKTYHSAQELFHDEKDLIVEKLTAINLKIAGVILVTTLTAEGDSFYLKARSTDTIDTETWEIFKSRFRRIIQEEYGLDCQLVISFMDHQAVREKSREDLNKKLSAINPDATSTPAPAKTGKKGGKNAEPIKAEKPGDVILGKAIKAVSTFIKDIDFSLGGESEGQNVVVNGTIFGVDIRELRSGKTLLSFNLTDDTGSITAKIFTESEDLCQHINKGMVVSVEGRLKYDEFASELMLFPRNIVLSSKTKNATMPRLSGWNYTCTVSFLPWMRLAKWKK